MCQEKKGSDKIREEEGGGGGVSRRGDADSDRKVLITWRGAKAAAETRKIRCQSPGSGKTSHPEGGRGGGTAADSLVTAR